MADEVLVYISAALDLEYERDLLGRAVTEIPVSLAWRIEQTPPGAKAPDLEAIVNADIHLILLGGDIRAPVGLELLAARRAGNRPLLYMKKDIMRTPAAQAFLREMERTETWRSFRDNSDLRHQVLLSLAKYILDNALHYVLRPVELENLQAWYEKLIENKPQEVEKTRGGAGESAVIISRERYIPSGGVLISKPKEEN
jgi:hypothetical protein